MLGVGTFAKVHIWYHKASKQKYAVKAVKKKSLMSQGDEHHLLLREIRILRIIAPIC